MTKAEQLQLVQECPSEFSEPYTGNIHDRHYSAMPANPYSSEAVKTRGRLVKNEIAKLFENPPDTLDIPESFSQFFEDDYYINVERRRMINFENFAKWREDHPRVHESLEPSIQRLEMGYAEVGDVLDAGLQTTLSGLEIGRVTHPYWRRIEHVMPMRLNVAAAITERDGKLEPFESPYRRIKIMPKIRQLGEKGEQEIVGFIVKYKHDIGSIPKAEGEALKIVERQIAAIRVDEGSGFPAEILQEMYAAAATTKGDKNPFYWDNRSDDRFDDLLASTRCRGFIEKAIQTDSGEPFIVPESTTMFCYTEKVPLERAAVQQKLATTAIRRPDRDDGIAFFNSNKS